MSASHEYRQLAARSRVLAQRESFPCVRSILTASAEKWEFLAEVAACQDPLGEPAPSKRRAGGAHIRRASSLPRERLRQLIGASPPGLA